MRRALTGSGLDLAMACAASQVLPWARSFGQPADDGSRGHAFLEAVCEHPELRDAWLASLPPHLQDRYARLDIAQALDGVRNARTEVAYVVDVEHGTARELGAHLGRAYGELGPRQIAMTLDVVGERDAMPGIIDWKTGRVVEEGAHEWQLRAQMLAVALTTDADEVAGAIGHVGPDGRVEHTWQVLDRFELADVRDELRALLGRIDEAARRAEVGALDVDEGEHCRYCPAYPSCPAKARLARAMMGELEPLEARVAALSLEDAGRAWARVREAEQLVDRIKKVLKERAHTELIPLESGKVLAQIEQRRDKWDTDKLIAIARAHGASDAEIHACRGETVYWCVRETKRRDEE